MCVGGVEGGGVKGEVGGRGVERVGREEVCWEHWAQEVGHRSVQS